MEWLKKIVRSAERTVWCYWFPLTLGFVLSGIFTIVELKARGRFAIGGEWLFPIFLCLIHYYVRAYFRERARRKRRDGRRIPERPQTARR